MLEFSSVDKLRPKFTTFPTESTGIIIIRDLEVRSMCAHHLAPFFGKCTIAYYPNKKMAGLSKFQRVLDYVAQNPTEQEALTEKLMNYLVEELNPHGLLVSIECVHTCMIVRGVQTSGSTTETMESFGTMNNLEVKALVLRK